MKIISLYIENFGTLSRYSYSFDDKINKLCKENGFGKTTLADFIKAMFYGLPNSQNKPLDLDYRKKYSPWNNGIFGGNLCFSIESKKYRVERTFGNTQSKDTFKLIDLKTNKESKEYSKDLGLEIFKIDEDAYSKSTYFPQELIQTKDKKENGSLKERLINLISDSTNWSNFDSAIKVLNNKKKIYKSKSETCLIESNHKKMNDLENDIDKLDKLSESINQTKEEIANLNVVIDELQKQKQKLNIEESKARDANYHNEIRSNYNNKKLEIENLLKEEKKLNYELNNKDFNIDEINYIDASVTKKNKLEAEISSLNNSNSFIKEKEILEQFERIPSLKEIDDYSFKAYQLNSYTEIDTLNDNQKKEFENLSIIFKDHLPDEKELDDYKNEYLSKQNDVSKTLPSFFKENLVITMLLTIFSVVLACLFFIDLGLQPWIRISCLIISLLSFIYLIFRSIYTSIHNKKIKLSQINDLQLLCENLNLYFLGYEIDNQNDILNNFNILNEKIESYKNLLTLYEKDLELNQKSDNEKQGLMENINNFVHIYKNQSESFIETLNQMRIEVKKIEDFSKENKEILNKIDLKRNELTSLNSSINAFFDGFHLSLDADDREKIVIIKNKFDARDRLQISISNKNKEISNYAKEKGVDEQFLNDTEDYDLDSIQANLSEIESKIQEKKEELNKKRIFIDEKEPLCDEIIILQDELELAKIKNKELNYEYEIITKTINYLTQAKESLSGSYIIPLEKGFEKYLSLATEDAETHLSIDTNFNISIERDGINRESEYFSKGYKDIFNFCMRCSLVEALFKSENPFIILDDPFVNLDEDKLVLGKRLLDLLSQKYQILYLTCHESRL